ncbi:unnamed protein product [Ectocarpus fasciculatus]
MGFFGMVLKPGQKESVEVPQGWCLQLCTAALEPAKAGVKPQDVSATLWVQVEGEIDDTFYLLGSLQGGGPCVQIPVGHCLTSVDGEVYMEAKGGGTVHLTGYFNREYDPDLENDDDSSEEESSEEGSEEGSNSELRSKLAWLLADAEAEDADEDEEEEDEEEGDRGSGRQPSKWAARRVRTAAAAAALMNGTGDGDDDSEDDSEVDGEYVPGDEDDDDDMDADGDDGDSDDDEEEEEEEEEEEDDDKKKNGKKRPASQQRPPPKKSKKSTEAEPEVEAAAAVGEGGAVASTEGGDEAKTSGMTKQERKRLRKKENKRKAMEAKKDLEEAFRAMDPEDGGEPAVGIPLKNPRTKTLKGGLKIKDTMLGGGNIAVPGKNVKICYEGCFPDGRVFDKNNSRRSPLKFRVGMKNVIVGMDRGVEGMRVGGSREISIPAALGYGKRGTGPIPPNQDLVFRVELIDVMGK